MDLPRLYPIVDVEVARQAGWPPQDLWRAFLAGGARLVQLRGKGLGSGALLELASALVDDARSAGAVAIVNDRADLAVLAGADGVHVGQDDLAVADVRGLVGPTAIVGMSTHTASQIDEALRAPISYLAVGPVFATRVKDTGDQPVGLELVRLAARAAAGRLPVVAIGGITLDRAPEVVAAGADSVAVITDLATESPEARVRQWLARLG
jgi:thiamine-phosphate pyrophosphorylase